MFLDRYKLAVILAVAAVACGLTCALASFNAIVAPEEPVQAIRWGKTATGVYSLEILGEQVTLQGLDDDLRNIFVH